MENIIRRGTAKFVIIHVRNEEYLLKWWIPHHMHRFDSGVVIDYGCTDGSIDLFRKLVPHWNIIKSNNKDFNPNNCDAEVHNVQTKILEQYPNSYVIALNATEFLIGDLNKLVACTTRIQKLIPCDVMCDPIEYVWKEPDETQSLIKQRYYGIQEQYDDTNMYNPWLTDNFLTAMHKYNDVFHYTLRFMRSLHNYNLDYLAAAGPGRHFWGTPCEDFRILWYGYSPYTRKMVDRKLAIKSQVPAEFSASHHMIDDDISMLRFKTHQQYTKSMKDLISKYEPNLWN